MNRAVYANLISLFAYDDTDLSSNQIKERGMSVRRTWRQKYKKTVEWLDEQNTPAPCTLSCQNRLKTHIWKSVSLLRE